MKQCKIILLDQVNAKIVGLELPDVRKCIKLLEFAVPGAAHLPSVKLGRWSGRTSFFSVGGGCQIGMLDRLIPYLEEENYDITVEDLRPDFNINFEQIDKTYNSDRTWQDSHSTKAGQPIELFDHQVEAINSFLANTKGIQSLPTSSGKTIVSATLSRIVEKYGRSIIIVPNKQLVWQTLADYELLGLDVGVYFGDRKDYNKTHTICTWQSLDRLNKETKPKGKKAIAEGKETDHNIESFKKDVIAIIGDECHLCDGAAIKSLFSKVFNHVPIRWGMTGTVPKEEFKLLSITGSIGPVINTIKSSDLQELGILSNCDIQIIQLQDDSKFKNYQEEHKYLVEDNDRIEIMANFINNISQSGNTLVLVQNIASGKKLQKLLPDSVFISGAVKVKDRVEEYDEIAIIDNKIIIATFGVASTGINVPRIFHVVIFEAGKSFTKVIQSIGRGLRKAHDKNHVTIWDFCASTKYSKKHLTTRKVFYKEQGFPFQIIKVNKNEL